jgi:hypothetical protein
MRRRRSDGRFLAVLIVIGLIAYMVKDITIPEGTWQVAFWVLGIGATIWIIARAVQDHSIKRSIHAQFAQATAIVERHAAELTVRRKQLTIKSHYGFVDDSGWMKEIVHFCTNIVLPQLPNGVWLGDNERLVAFSIHQRTKDFESSPVGYSSAISPRGYEQLVAQTLSELGWHARVTGATGDQGIDVIAIKLGAKLVVQCKHYSTPVGNDAVQEVIAGREFEQASYAAVVSNMEFTRAAKQLASNTRVLLLHHDQLVRIDSLLGLDDG